MARRFFLPFLSGLALFALLIFLGDMFDKMSILLKSKATMWVIIQYLWLEVPYWTIRVIPMATLMATLFSLTGFIQSGEWLAAQASGFETKDFWKPLLGCALVVTFGSFLAQETVLPACYARAQFLWKDSIHPEWEWDKFFDITLIGGPDEFIQAKTFIVKDGAMERPILERIGPTGTVVNQLDADKALWKEGPGRWLFLDGVERVTENGRTTETAFKEKMSDLAVPPRNLMPRTRNPDEMSLREIKSYEERVAHLGVSPRELEVAAAGKLAYPFTNFVICALGIPVALRLRRLSKIINFCAAFGLSFAFLWFMEIGRMLGNAGQLPAPVAAWLANVLFAGIALLMIRRYETEL
jgi:lipopolysaccharide export system permease protein